MSYDVQLFRIETKEREQQANNPDFFENEENLLAFSEEQLLALNTSLVNYQFIEESKDRFGTHLYNESFGISALLTKSGVYFQCGWDGDSIFELSMMASELTDTDEFAKYDPQNDGWEN